MKKQTVLIFISALYLLALAGCLGYQREPVHVYTKENERRFDETEEGREKTAVENAVMWSKKYDELNEKYERLTRENTDLKLENNNLKAKTAQLQKELERTEQELAEANQFLQELQLELTKWKSDVLGFRDEIKAANSAQLKALTKILRLLGAEPIRSEQFEENTEGTENE